MRNQALTELVPETPEDPERLKRDENWLVGEHHVSEGS